MSPDGSEIARFQDVEGEAAAFSRRNAREPKLAPGFQCFFVSRSSLRHSLGESERPYVIDQAMNRRGRAR